MLGKRTPKFLSKHEIEHLREGFHTSKENALFEFFYPTGCRIGEVAKLNRDHIKRYLEERHDDEPCLFVTKRK